MEASESCAWCMQGCLLESAKIQRKKCKSSPVQLAFRLQSMFPPGLLPPSLDRISTSTQPGATRSLFPDVKDHQTSQQQICTNRDRPRGTTLWRAVISFSIAQWRAGRAPSRWPQVRYWGSFSVVTVIVLAPSAATQQFPSVRSISRRRSPLNLSERHAR